jgi:DNA repair protein RadA/Sms
VCALARGKLRTVYVSGEEAVDQVRLRARRLGLQDAPVELASATNVRDILSSIEGQHPAVLVIDSIQTMFVDSVESAPGTVTQVRASTQEIIRVAKAGNMAVIFVGHVTKDGQIAGPRVLEHMVDTVLYFEGDRSHHFRILRAVKNRFGATDEIGVFEMAREGLVEVENPSALFLAQRSQDVAGSAVLAALEGTRPLLVEVQALVAPSTLGSPRRAVIGWDPNRLAMIVAVLETRCGLQLSGCDIFLNIAGGIRIAEPAADLAVAAALISALRGTVLPPESVFFGEIGLAGEVRPVAQPDLRCKEAAKLGFKEAVLPLSKTHTDLAISDISLRTVTHVQDLMG